MFFRGTALLPPRAGVTPRITGRLAGSRSLPHLQPAGRHADPDLVRRHVAGHHRSGTDDRAVADRDPLDDADPGPEPAVASDSDRLDDGALVHDEVVAPGAVVLVVDLAVRADLRVVPDDDAPLRGDDAVAPDADVPSEGDDGLRLRQLEIRVRVDRAVVADHEPAVVRHSHLDVRLHDDVPAHRH